MEVVLKNLPVGLADDSLRQELTPFMNALGIVDWTCDKPRRKPLGWVTFLDPSDGQKFLNRHEKLRGQRLHQNGPAASRGLPHANGRPRDIARLHILSSAVYVERSTRNVGKLTISHLKHEHEERKRGPDRGHRGPAITCEIHTVACGKNVFCGPADTLTFARQCLVGERGYAKFGRRCFTATWPDETRMDVPYDTVQDFVTNDSDQSMTFVLTEPPRFYSKLPSTDSYAAKWERKTSCPVWPSHARYVAHCLVYRVDTSAGYSKAVRALKAEDILSVTRQSISVDATPEPLLHDYSTSMRAFEGKMQSLGAARDALLPFAMLFQVQALVWNNYLHPAGGLGVLQIMERIARDATSRGQGLPFTADTMKQLLQKIPYPCPGTEASEIDPAGLMDEVMRAELELRMVDALRSGAYGPSLARHQAWVLKAMVTPTRILLQGPDAESKNRVLRMFPQHSDHFLRVSFGDEDGRDLSFSPKVSNETVFERYRKVLREGIQIAGRRFSFLGFSHSSLRSHSTWFMAPFVDGDWQRQDHDTILETLGDFSEIRVPAKCAARIGQAFSETPYAVDLFKAGIGIRFIPDVKSADGSRVFSDGVGTVSRDAMEEIWNALPMRSAAPTCFQIRWAGVKGMLGLDSSLRGKVICVRKESMMKFPSRDLGDLGICDVASRPLRLVLNRQIIKILEDMGTADDWFLTLQNKALNMLRGVTATAANTSTFLQYQDIGSTLGLPAFIKHLDRMGIDYRRDRFLRSVVEHVVLRELRLLKHKARIPVNMGVTLFGIMDESGFLRENEVYVTYDDVHAKSGHRMDASLADGPVIVTRCPALHPGDVQYVRTVRPPAGHPLRDLKNCIVFSQHGSRDLPSQLSGGDLDGDLYNVIWDPSARPKRTFSPADYPRVVPEPLGRAVTRDDIADFFINFMKSDILGLIANRHQIVADVQDDGTSDPSCIRLAEMHSTAVDFSKTGIAVKLNDMPKPPRTRPDLVCRSLAPAPPLKLYDVDQIAHIGELDAHDEDEEDGMGRANHRYHRSEKILGRLYRGVDERKIWNEDIHRNISMDGPSVWEQLMGRTQAELETLGLRTVYDYKYREQAWKIRNLYEDSITDSMWHFSENPRTSISEVEVFCGSVLNKTGTQTRRQRDSSIRLKEETDRVLAWIVKLIRDRAGLGDDGTSSEASGEVSADDREGKRSREVLRLCWACLLVGCGRGESAGGGTYHGGGEVQSFRVVAATCLLRELNSFRVRVGTKSFGGGYVGVSGRQPTKRVGFPHTPSAARKAPEAEEEAESASVLLQPFARLNVSRSFPAI
ncbi:RNA-dependent RNA polymerase 1 [Tolypocladium capitatum]|uniref:RNA-dependent RNA polymerase n=1 Tax=Tolypocladium capitatum TaxID=45235 RepID=A0A2K3QNU3_9HYPO|nr:RNA-dependent RNA polymerase 1 [Tolypocladium capitatum]